MARFVAESPQSDSELGTLLDTLQRANRLWLGRPELPDYAEVSFNFHMSYEPTEEHHELSICYSPQDAELDVPSAQPASKVRSALLTDGRILVDYVAGEKLVYAYVLSQTGLEFVTLGERERAETEIEAFLADMSDPDDLGTVKEIVARGHRLYTSLLEPVLESVKSDVSEILVVTIVTPVFHPFDRHYTKIRTPILNELFTCD